MVQRNRDPAVADLYHENATLNAGDDIHEGRDAIRAFYLGVFSGTGPQPRVRGLWNSGSIYAALLEEPDLKPPLGQRLAQPKGQEQRAQCRTYHCLV